MNIDLDRIAKLLGVAGSSVHDPEALSALRLVDREIRKAGLGWADLINSSRELAVADEAAAVLLAENITLREELDIIRGHSHTRGGGQWDDVANSSGSVNVVAQWAIGLHQSHAVALTEREIDFLNRCCHWRGRLTPRMSDWFDDLVTKVSYRAGQSPPL